jgi:hypothetical protein
MDQNFKFEKVKTREEKLSNCICCLRTPRAKSLTYGNNNGTKIQNQARASIAKLLQIEGL